MYSLIYIKLICLVSFLIINHFFTHCQALQADEGTTEGVVIQNI